MERSDFLKKTFMAAGGLATGSSLTAKIQPSIKSFANIEIYKCAKEYETKKSPIPPTIKNKTSCNDQGILELKIPICNKPIEYEDYWEEDCKIY